MMLLYLVSMTSYMAVFVALFFGAPDLVLDRLVQFASLASFGFGVSSLFLFVRDNL